MKIETLQFHARIPAISDDIAQKLAAAEEAIYGLFVQGRPAYFGYSGGKDSSVCVDIGLRAARRFKAEGGEPVLVVGTSGFCRIRERRRVNRVNCGARTQDESICSTSKGCVFLST
jgi:hypothetical protein